MNTCEDGQCGTGVYCEDCTNSPKCGFNGKCDKGIVIMDTQESTDEKVYQQQLGRNWNTLAEKDALTDERAAQAKYNQSMRALVDNASMTARDDEYIEVDQHILETFHKLESDPHGTDAHAPGAKLDAGKNRIGLVLGDFPLAIQAVCEVGTYGANKYSESGWLSVPNAPARYNDALLRHVFKEFSGERNDPDTDLPHAAHAAWNALAVLELALRELNHANES